MNRRPTIVCVAAAALLAIAGCETAQLPPSAGYGPQPQLPSPEHGLWPTAHVAKAVGWPAQASPRAATGLRVNAFASGLDHPRWIHVLPNGDVLVAETNSPPRPAGGFMAWAMGKLMSRAGAAVPSPNRLILLRDADGDGVAETRSVFASGLNSPFGMALVGDRLFIANTDGIVELHYTAGAMQAEGPAKPVVDLPANPPNGPLGAQHPGESRRHEALCDGGGRPGTSLIPASKPSAIVRRSTRWTWPPASAASSPRVCAIRTGSPGIRAPVRCGPSSTSATGSAAISCRTTSRRCATARSTAGRGATTARTWMIA